jgi:hypothetical protein
MGKGTIPEKYCLQSIYVYVLQSNPALSQGLCMLSPKIFAENFRFALIAQNIKKFLEIGSVCLSSM